MLNDQYVIFLQTIITELDTIAYEILHPQNEPGEPDRRLDRDLRTILEGAYQNVIALIEEVQRMIAEVQAQDGT